MNIDQLKYAMHLGNLGEQVFLQSQKAFDALVFLSADPVDKAVFLPMRQARENKARESFHKMKTGPQVLDGILALDLYRNQMKNDDERLR